MTFKLRHIINPVNINEGSDLFIAQPITFESFAIAKECIKTDADIDVRQYTTQYKEDYSIIAPHLNLLSDLDRSVLDVATVTHNRKLPLIAEVLEKLYKEVPDEGYMIYTNVDIALMPNFYKSVAHIIKSGYDAFIINRRTIPSIYDNPNQLSWMYMEAGKPHPGYDCFVFKRELFQKFELGNVCIGANFIGKALIINMMVHAQRFKIFKDLHLTFHIGDDRAWKNPRFRDYDEHNQKEVERIIDRFLELDLPNEKRQFLEQQRLLMNRAMGGGTDRTDFIGRAARKLRKVFGA